jgi:hypothetical protein
MSVRIGRQNIILLFWKWWDCSVSFLGIHKWEAEFYIGFSPALHLQRTFNSSLVYTICTEPTNRHHSNHTLYAGLVQYSIGYLCLLAELKRNSDFLPSNGGQVKLIKNLDFLTPLLFRYTLMAEFCGEAGRKYAFISSWIWLVCGLVGTDLHLLFLSLLAWKK